jgi:hypothetical protein
VSKNYPENSHKNLIGEWVQVWVPQYHPENLTKETASFNWEQVGLYHGRVGQAIRDDEDSPTMMLAAFQIVFDDGDSVWCWRRELRPVPKPEGQIRLI